MDKLNFEEEWDIIRSLVKMIASSATEIGNSKKINCKNFEQIICSAWSWENKPAFPFQMGESKRQGIKWYINPNPMFCAICHRFKATL